MRVFPTAVVALLAAGLMAGPGVSQVRVIGNSLAASCSDYAFLGDTSRSALRVCTNSLENEANLADTRAATFVNRGVIHMRRGMYDNARRDFDDAEDLMPEMAETYVNRGALLFRLGQYTDAVAETNRGIALGVDEPEKAYYNRGLMLERLDDFEGAYRDFRRAQELNPAWELPGRQLSRYQVSARE